MPYRERGWSKWAFQRSFNPEYFSTPLNKLIFSKILYVPATSTGLRAENYYVDRFMKLLHLFPAKGIYIRCSYYNFNSLNFGKMTQLFLKQQNKRVTTLPC